MVTNVVAHRPTNVVPNRTLYRVLWLFGAALIIITLSAAYTSWAESLIDKFGIAFNSGPTMTLFVLFYLAFSLREVSADEVGAAFCYGGALVALTSGLHFVPFGLMQIRKGPRTVQEFQSPGEPEKVQKTEDSVPLESGMVRPIRVVTGGPKAGKDDILDTRMTITLSFFVQWAITDVLLYASNYGSAEEIEKQVRDIGEAILAEIATEHTPAGFIDSLPKINILLVARIGERFENSGVRIISTRLVSPDVSHEVSKALAGIPKARAETKQVEIRAEGDKTSRIKIGEGTAAAELALLTAQAKGRKAMKEALDISGESVIAAEAIRGLSDKTDVLVAGAEGGMRDMMSLVKGAQSALNPSRGAKK
jgi:regulator of protease activity HflC (stomatin/prohibitin superfamily)